MSADTYLTASAPQVDWIRENPSPIRKQWLGDNVAFGTAFTRTMVSLRWLPDRGWFDGHVGPHQAITMVPSMVGLHYGQVVFEGLKAFRLPDGSVAVFRLHDHARRFIASSVRLAMPPLDEQLFVTAVEELIRADYGDVPEDPQRSFYLRPIMFADEPCLALRPANSYRFLLIAFVTEEFFGANAMGVEVWASDNYVRAAPGGVGAAKAAGNYAPGYLAQAEATAHGCQQVLWLDAAERRWVEEMGGMNIFLVRRDQSGTHLVTPPLSGTILAGITRDSLLTISAELGLRAVEQPILLDDWRAWAADGEVLEAFACGTAAAVTPIHRVVTRDGAWAAGTDPEHPVTTRLRTALVRIQRGQDADRHAWRHVIDQSRPSVVDR